MAKFVTIDERIHCISPVIRKAMEEMNPEPILKRAKEQLDAGATYLDVNIGPAENNGEELMKWAVTTIQDAFDNVPLALDTAALFLDFSTTFVIVGTAIKAITASITITASNSINVKPFFIQHLLFYYPQYQVYHIKLSQSRKM